MGAREKGGKERRAAKVLATVLPLPGSMLRAVASHFPPTIIWPCITHSDHIVSALSDAQTPIP